MFSFLIKTSFRTFLGNVSMIMLRRKDCHYHPPEEEKGNIVIRSTRNVIYYFASLFITLTEQM